MVNRLLNPLLSKSFFLFGARGTGKTSWLQGNILGSSAHYLNLLIRSDYERLLLNPSAFPAELGALGPEIEWVVIDEVQKIPSLLDAVHQEIEQSKLNGKPLKFALTGSSARKLKRGAANLLAGRANVYHLFPFTHIELADNFRLQETLEWGSLPELGELPSEREKLSFLDSYTHTYLQEEIIAEQIVRNIVPFRKFLQVAAQMNGQVVNYSKIARDVGADVTTVQQYFEVLEDTMVMLQLPPFHKSIRKRQRKNPKYYFFDLGVTRALSRSIGIPLQAETYAYGRAFEHFLILEIHRLQKYFEKRYEMSYLLSGNDAEIDLVIERPGLPTALVEIKSASLVTELDSNNLARFAKDIPNSIALLLSQDPHPKKFGSVLALPWQKGVQELGLSM